MGGNSAAAVRLLERLEFLQTIDLSPVVLTDTGLDPTVHRLRPNFVTEPEQEQSMKLEDLQARGLIDQMGGRESAGPGTAVDTQESAARARSIIMETERSLGFDPTDREFEKLGYDIESRVPDTGKLRFIEVKGQVSGASTITVTRNEILYSLNKPEDFILGIVEFLDDGGHRVHYVREPFRREPDFGVTSVNYDFAELLARAESPR